MYIWVSGLPMRSGASTFRPHLSSSPVAAGGPTLPVANARGASAERRDARRFQAAERRLQRIQLSVLVRLPMCRMSRPRGSFHLARRKPKARADLEQVDRRQRTHSVAHGLDRTFDAPPSIRSRILPAQPPLRYAELMHVIFRRCSVGQTQAPAVRVAPRDRRTVGGTFALLLTFDGGSSDPERRTRALAPLVSECRTSLRGQRLLPDRLQALPG